MNRNFAEEEKDLLNRKEKSDKLDEQNLIETQINKNVKEIKLEKLRKDALDNE